MQIKYPHRKFYRIDPIREPVSTQAAERFDLIRLYDELRSEGASERAALKAAGCSRATLYRWKRRLREQGVRALADRCRRPRRVRRRQWTAAELELVRQARQRFPLRGRAKIRAVLARERGFAPSASTTGRMISRLVRTGQAEPVAFHYGRVKPKRQRKFDRHARRRRCGARGRKPGRMVQIDRLSVSIEAGFAVKESEAVCPVSKLCYMRAYSRANAAGRYEFHQFYAGELSVGALNVELAEFERFYNAYRPHQALGQRTPMQAYNENFKQSALAA